ncbi:MAG: AsmA family protein [Gammaproteobacteria bacterium]
MRKTIRRFLLLTAYILLVVSIVIGVGIYKPRIYESALNTFLYDKTGYQYSTRELSIQLSPTIIKVAGLELRNPEWIQDPKLLSVKNAEISLNLKQFINKENPFWSAALHDVDVQVHEDGESQLNWNTSTLANIPKQEAEEPLVLKNLLSFSEITIHQAKVSQKKTGVSEEIDVSDLIVKRLSDLSVLLNGTGTYKQQGVEINGNIDIDDQSSTEQVLQFSINANGLGIDLQSTGAVNLNDIEKTNVSINAQSENLDKLEAFFETTLPAVTPINVSLDFLSSKGSYEISKINLQMGENILTGDVLFDTKDAFLRADLSSEKIDLAPFVAVQTNKDVGLVKGATSFQEAEIDWAWMDAVNSEINLEVDEISANEYALKNVSAALKLNNGVLDIDNLSARYEQQLVGNDGQSFISELIKISGTVNPVAKQTQGGDVHMSIHMSEHESLLSLEGIANINGIEGNHLKVNADFSNLDSLSKYLQTDLLPYLPAKISANIETSEHEVLVNNLVATSQESDLSGDVKVDWSGERVSVSGSLNSELLDFSPVFVEKNARHEDGKNAPKEDKIFSAEIIDWSWLEAYKAKLNLEVNKLIVNKNVFNKVKTNLDMGNGSLKIKPLQAVFANGSVKSALSLNKSGDSVMFDTQLDAINLSLADMGVTGDSVLKGGTTDLVMKFSGQGASLHQIMSSLNGEMVAEVQKGIIKNDAFEAIGTDIIFEMLSMLNPFMKEDETTELKCAAVKFTAENGVLTSKNQLAVETSKMKIVGGGIVDLNTEELEIGFSPSAKKGVGINVGSLVKFVRLGGTLNNPHPEADPVGILKSGAAIGAAVSTGGLSLLVEGLFKRAANSGSACNQALKDIDDQAEDMDIKSSDNEQKTSE